MIPPTGQEVAAMFSPKIDVLALVAVVIFLSGVLVFISQWIWPLK
jgi:hypothetical protein